MKKYQFILLTTMLVLFNQVLFAQQEKSETSSKVRTLFSNEDGRVNHGGYLGITIAYSEIENQPALQLGGRLAWVINHQFAMGIAANGFFNNLDKSGSYKESDYFLAGGYGGLFFQPILFPKSPVHVSFPFLLGVGGIAVNNYREWNKHPWDEANYSHDYYYDSDVFLVLEPGIDIEFNMLNFMRMSLGATYRFTNSVNLKYDYIEAGIPQSVLINPKSLNGFTFRIAMLFGWF